MGALRPFVVEVRRVRELAESDMATVEVEVPPDFKEGHNIIVQGKNFIVPPGLKGGDKFLVKIPKSRCPKKGEVAEKDGEEEEGEGDGGEETHKKEKSKEDGDISPKKKRRFSARILPPTSTPPSMPVAEVIDMKPWTLLGNASMVEPLSAEKAALAARLKHRRLKYKVGVCVMLVAMLVAYFTGNEWVVYGLGFYSLFFLIPMATYKFRKYSLGKLFKNENVHAWKVSKELWEEATRVYVGRKGKKKYRPHPGITNKITNKIYCKRKFKHFGQYNMLGCEPVCWISRQHFYSPLFSVVNAQERGFVPLDYGIDKLDHGYVIHVNYELRSEKHKNSKMLGKIKGNYVIPLPENVDEANQVSAEFSQLLGLKSRCKALEKDKNERVLGRVVDAALFVVDNI